MGKKWVKFLKDYKNPSDEKEFKKDSILQLDDATADSLIGLKFAEATEAPKDEDIIKQALEGVTANLQSTLEKMVVDTVANVSKNVDERVKSVIRVTKEETPEEQYSRLWKNEGDFLQAVIKSSQGTIDERFTTKAPTGLNTLDDKDGAFLIPDTWASGIWTNMRDNEMSLLGRTDQRTTSGNNLKMNAMRETSRKSGYRHAGMLAYWTAEAAEFTASQPKFERFGLDLHKLTALYYATDEELDDASVSIPGVVNRLATQAMMFLVNEALYDGSGVGKPTGILRTDALIKVVPEAGQTATQILHANINKMYYRLAPEYRAGAVWLVHPNVEEKLPFIQFNDDTTGRPVPIYFPPGTEGLASSPTFGRLMGLPVIPFEHCKDLSVPGDICLANWGEYITLTKAGAGIKQASSIHLRFLYEETAFRFSFRVGGGTPHSSPVTDLNGTQTRGPFVVLGSRETTPTSSGL